MHIVFHHPSKLPVLKYGGTERIIYWLIKELASLGHQVTLIGHPSSDLSHTNAKLHIPSHPEEWWRDLDSIRPDFLHLFTTPPFQPNCPYLVTIEGNGQIGEVYHPNTVFVSKKHAQIHGSDQFVYNGLDFDEYPKEFIKKSPLSWENFFFLAKASWKVKNLKHCLRACRQSKKFLHVAGGNSFLPRRRVKFYGMIDQEKKRELMPKMDALLFPVRWHEPFGISIIEAMAYGIPVIGSSYGSLPELISKEVGIICQNFNELKEILLQRTYPDHFLPPEEIRDYAKTKFSSKIMALEYLKKYELVKETSSNSSHPKSFSVLPVRKLENAPDELLPF